MKIKVISAIFGSVLCFCGVGQLAAEVLIQEDFSNGLADWELAGSPLSKIVDVHGKQAVFDNNGDPHCNSNAAHNKPISVQSGMSIEADVYLQVDDLSGCWVGASLELTKKQYASGVCQGDGFIGESLMSLFMVGDACWAESSQYRRHSYVGSSLMPLNGQANWFLADQYVNNWHRLKVDINQSGFVDWYIDELHIGRSEEPIGEEYQNNSFPPGRV